ncbi:MAG: proteasome accessory factor PafA2 family protein [Leptospirales bacterium]
MGKSERVVGIVGTEVEYGLSWLDRTPEDQGELSRDLISGVSEQYHAPVLWDYENEDPRFDARGFLAEGDRENPDDPENRRLNKPLYNGGRLYVDGSHPEYSGPECLTVRDVVRYERAGDRMLVQCRESLTRRQGGGPPLLVLKNNADGKGNSWGYHENYLLPRSIPFETLSRGVAGHLVTRVLFCGAGKLGSDISLKETGTFHLSQRAEFFEVPVGLSTMVRRSVINTRDEPHSERSRYRRFHVITGDSNLSEISTYLKVGTTLLLLRALEAGALNPPVLSDWVGAFHTVSGDRTFRKPLELEGGRTMTALEFQEELHAQVLKFLELEGMDAETSDLVGRWGEVLGRIRHDPGALSRSVDWAIKWSVLERYRERKGWDFSDSRLKMLDYQYHDLRPEKGIFSILESSGQVDRLLDPMDIEDALIHPPTETRAYFRGEILRRFPRQVHAVSWSSVVMDTGDTALKRIPLLDPWKGTQKRVGSLIGKAGTARELVNELIPFRQAPDQTTER